ncbi:MAG TPA: FkbM family methyltransferase [Blastocatellia bacterium]|nr:FkbM family methyltransferase [Blastocatellia bacterium]
MISVGLAYKRIKATKAPNLSTSSRFFTFLRLKIKRAIVRNILRIRPNREHLFGQVFKFADYKSFLLLFEEIFINLEYYFPDEKPPAFILDCGSNIGMATLFFKLIYPNSRVIAFEPDQYAFSCLQENIEKNHWTDVKAYNVALSDSVGQTTFFIDPARPGSLDMSTIQERMPKASVKVSTDILSKYVNGQVDLVKLDVEGAELTILEELVKTGKLKSIKRIVLEYHHHIHRDRDELAQFLKILEAHGFGYLIKGNTSPPFKAGTFQDIIIYAYTKA